MITFLDFLFIAASTLVLIHGLNNQMNIGVAAYLSCYLAFALVTHAIWRLGANVSYGFEHYLVTHVASFLFLALTVVLSKRDVRQNDLVLRASTRVRPTVLLVAFAIWIAFQFYLLAKYGASGALRLGDSSALGQQEIAYVDSSTLMLVNTFASGAALVVVTRLGVEPAFIRNPLVMSAFAVFIVYALAFGAALAGGRRTVLILAICFLVARLTASGENVSAALRRNLSSIVLALVVCLGLAWYYQEIRNNVYLPAVQQSLADPDPSTKMEGVTQLLTPGLADVYASGGGSASTVNRSGPFDFLYSIVEGRNQFNRSADGELTLFSIGKAIPKLFYPDKPEYDVDYLIGMRFGVVMGRNFATDAEFFRAPDYSTTVFATLFADFGWVAVPLAAAIAVLVMRLSISVVGVAPASALVVLGAMGVMFELISMIEGSLSHLLASLRTLLMVAGVAFALRFVGLARRRPVRKRPA